MRIAGPRELVSEGDLEYVAFAVSRKRLERIDVRTLEPGQDDLPAGYRVRQRRDSALIAMRLLGDLEDLRCRSREPAVLDAIGEKLLRLALRLDGPVDLIPVERLGTSSSRLAVVRRVEDYLEVNDEVAPSITTLCEITGVCERTLEYAFREHLGVAPARYLKLRRLAQVWCRLQNPVTDPSRVTEVATRFGFYELGPLRGRLPQALRRAPVADARALVVGRPIGRRIRAHAAGR